MGDTERTTDQLRQQGTNMLKCACIKSNTRKKTNLKIYVLGKNINSIVQLFLQIVVLFFSSKTFSAFLLFLEKTLYRSLMTSTSNSLVIDVACL